MKRIVLDVPRWHAYLHRDARGLETATERDGPVQKLADELFDRLYSGETERLPERKQDPKLRAWADGIHTACEQLPAFGRLASECRGDSMASGTAVETLLADLQPEPPQEPGNAAPQGQPGPSRRALGGACEKASAAVEDLRETLDGLAEVGFPGLPGTSSALGGEMPPKAIRALAARLKSDARLKQIALLAGRFKRIAASKRRQRLKHGADEIADIEQGADLGRLLPSELLKLSHPKLRAAFMRNYVERAALEYALIGNEVLGKGPLIVLLDKSGSMDGPRDVWATALALALLDQARHERRAFALVCFDYQVKFEALVKPGENLPEEGLFVACAGGTEIGTAVTRGLEIIKANEGQLRKADLVLVTDGGSDTASAPLLREAAKLIGVTIIGLGIGVEREWLVPWCDDVQVVTDLARIEEGSAERLFAA
jgi:Mg-chelatase subunit ChlD